MKQREGSGIFAQQVKVADDLRPVAQEGGYLNGEIVARHGQPVAMVHLIHIAAQQHGVPVHGHGRATVAFAQVVRRADEVIRFGTGRAAAVRMGQRVQLKPSPQARKTGLRRRLQGAKLRKVARLHVRGHGIVRVKALPGVPRESQAHKAQSAGRLHHGGDGVRAVAPAGMGVGIARKRHCMRSCFTFLSITWRRASSRTTSSSEMPISTISTMAW